MMSKTPKSIFKMQDAGNVPEVNQYGLTEEQMQSVRDNMRRYGISEEEAVTNKINAMKETNNWGRELYRSLGGMYRVTADKLDSQLTPMQKEAYTSGTDRIVNNLYNTTNNLYRSVEYDPYWKIKLQEKADGLLRNTKYLSEDTNKYLNWVVNKKSLNEIPKDPTVGYISTTMNNGQLRNYKDYEKYKKEYLDSHPVNDIWNYFPDNYLNVTSNTNPTTMRNQEAHDYALGKLQEQWKNDQELSTFFPNSNYLSQKTKENAYGSNFQSPSEQFKTGVKSGALLGAVAGSTLATPFIFAPSFAPAAGGIVGGLTDVAGAYLGSLAGEKVLGAGGRWIDRHVDYNKIGENLTNKSYSDTQRLLGKGFKWLGSKQAPLETSGSIIGGFWGWGKGMNLARKGLIKGTNAFLQHRANTLFANGARSATFELPEKWIGKEVQYAMGIDRLGRGVPVEGSYAAFTSIFPQFKNRKMQFRFYNPEFMTPVNRSTQSINSILNPTPNSFLLGNNFRTKLLPMPTYKYGGILKNQIGGLVYKPYIPEQNEGKQSSSTTLSYEPEDAEEGPFQIEPVRIYSRPTSIVQEQIEEAPVVQEQEQKQESSEPVLETGFTDKEMKVLYEDGSNEEKQRVSIKYLQQKLNLTKEQAAAIVGQWQRESHFRLNAENKEEKAGKNNVVKSSQYGIGIGQWTGSRHDAFVKYINSHGGVANLKTQLDFAISEIKNNPDFLNNLRNASTIEDASAYVYVQYVAAQYKGIKNTDDLYSKVKAISENYRKKHQQMYGRSSDTFGVGLRNAIDSLNLLG